MIKVLLKKNYQDEKIESHDQESQTHLGGFLREARKSKGLTSYRLSELTRIPVWHLKALEEGHYGSLPPEVYLKGVFFRLAKFLDLIPKDILDKYYQDNPIPKIITEKLPAGHFQRFGQFWALTPKKIAILASALFLVLIASYLWYQYNVFTGPPSLILMNPKGDSEVQSPELKVDGYTSSDIYLTINGQNIYVNQDGTFTSMVNLAAGMNAIEVKAKNRFGKESKIVRQILYKTNSSSLQPTNGAANTPAANP